MTLTALALLTTLLLAFLGAALGLGVTRATARELDRRRKRYETMWKLRWVTDMALDRWPSRPRVGLGVVNAVVVAAARQVTIDSERKVPP